MQPAGRTSMEVIISLVMTASSKLFGTSRLGESYAPSHIGQVQLTAPQGLRRHQPVQFSGRVPIYQGGSLPGHRQRAHCQAV